MGLTQRMKCGEHSSSLATSDASCVLKRLATVSFPLPCLLNLESSDEFCPPAASSSALRITAASAWVMDLSLSPTTAARSGCNSSLFLSSHPSTSYATSPA